MRHLVLLGVTHFPGADEQVKGEPTAATGIVKRQRGTRISSSQPGKTTALTISKILAASIGLLPILPLLGGNRKQAEAEIRHAVRKDQVAQALGLHHPPVVDNAA